MPTIPDLGTSPHPLKEAADRLKAVRTLVVDAVQPDGAFSELSDDELFFLTDLIRLVGEAQEALYLATGNE